MCYTNKECEAVIRHPKAAKQRLGLPKFRNRREPDRL